MIINVNDKELKQFIETGKSNNKLLKDRKILRENFKTVIDVLYLVNYPAELYNYGGLHFENLKGMKIKNKYSVKLDSKYRLEFLLNKERQNKKDVYICTIIEISSHYGGKKRKK